MNSPWFLNCAVVRRVQYQRAHLMILAGKRLCEGSFNDVGCKHLRGGIMHRGGLNKHLIVTKAVYVTMLASISPNGENISAGPYCLLPSWAKRTYVRSEFGCARCIESPHKERFVASSTVIIENRFEPRKKVGKSPRHQSTSIVSSSS